MTKKKLVDATELSLDEWLEVVLKPEHQRGCRIEDSHFTTDAHLDEFLDKIDARSNDQIIAILRLFLFDGGHLGVDKTHRQWLLSMDSDELAEKRSQHSYFDRLMDLSGSACPWQGTTWVIDLLPDWPQAAIDALDAYHLAHCQLLPDGRLHGLNDATTIIRRKFLEHPLPVKETLLDLTPRDFELLAGHLFKKKGYDVTVTPRSSDGGYDVLALRTGPRGEERLHVECKRYTENVGVQIVRATLGTLVVKNATLAVIVATSRYTKAARKEAIESKRIELIDVDEFDKDLRQYVDPNWTSRLSRYVGEMKRDLVGQKKS